MTFILLLPVIRDTLWFTFRLPWMDTLAVSSLLFTWLTKGFANRKVSIQKSPTYFLLLLIGATAFLSITSSYGPPFVKLYRAVAFSYTRLFLVFLVMNLIQTWAQVRRAMYMLIALAVFHAGVALCQFLIYEWTGVSYSFADEDQMFRVTPERIYLRASGLARETNYVGILMAVAAIWALCLGLSAVGTRKGSRIAHFVLFLILASGVVVTFSRSSLLSLMIVGLMIPLVYRELWTGIFAIVCGVLGVGAMVAGRLEGLVTIFGDPSGDVLLRVDLNRLGLRALWDNPLTGVGIGSFAAFDNPYEFAVHNLLIQPGAEMGVPGLFFFLVLTGSVAFRLVRAGWQPGDLNGRAFLVALSLGYVAELLMHMSNPVLADLFFWFYVGLSEAALSIQRSGASRCQGEA